MLGTWLPYRSDAIRYFLLLVALLCHSCHLAWCLSSLWHPVYLQRSRQKPAVVAMWLEVLQDITSHHKQQINLRTP